MKVSSLILTASVFTATVSAFTPSNLGASNALQNVVGSSVGERVSPLGVGTFGASTSGAINVADEMAQRDVYSMESWALQYGVQKVDGVEFYSADGVDYELITNQNIGAGSPVLFIPADIVLSSDAVVNEFGGSLQQAEAALVQSEQGLAQRLPLFRLMVKILAEYEKGQDSPYFPWLNSVPKRFFNGVAMTGKCREHYKSNKKGESFFAILRLWFLLRCKTVVSI